MYRDIRKFTGDHQKQKTDLPINHRERFERKLAFLPQQRKKNNWAMGVAAAAIILMALGFVLKYSAGSAEDELPMEPIDLAMVSPELKQLETNYLTAINYEMLGIEANEGNRAILDDYFKKVDSLSKEYDHLAKAVVTQDIDEQLIDRLIDNLKQRLQLLLELKEKLKNLKENKNENNTTLKI